jgi:hypothetical protein
MVRVLGFENCFRIICREGGIEDSLKDTVYSSLCVNYDRRELVVKNLVGLGNIAWMDLPYLFVWESGDGVRDNRGRGQGTVPSSSK